MGKKTKQYREVKYQGEINLAGNKIPCYVLDDYTRVLSGRQMQESLKMVDNKQKGKQSPGTRLNRYLNQKSLKSFIFSNKKPDHFEPILCYKGEGFPETKTLSDADVDYTIKLHLSYNF